ncbi:MAG: peptidase domain-containing ABC transporter [Oscillospiraceae bacterium]|nr:peptidase domain-containing ABC transporter [Oscillospiraceae bacterium]
MKIKIVKQHDIKDCGPACLSMVFHCYGLILPLAELRGKTKADNNGVNFFGLVDCATNFGFSAQAMNGDHPQLLHGIKSGEIKLPMIARIVANGIEHYVVVYKISKNWIYIADPADGKKRMGHSAFAAVWSGHIVNIIKTENSKEGNYKKGKGKRYLSLITRQYPLMLLIFGVSVLIAAIGIFGSFIFQMLFDAIETSGDARFLNIGLTNICCSVIGAYVLRMVGEILRGHLLGLLSRRADVSLVSDYFDHLISLPLKDVLNRRTGELMSRFNDATNITQLVSGTGLSLVLDVLILLACSIALLTISGYLFSISMLIVLLYVTVVACFFKSIEKTNRKLMEDCAEVSSNFNEAIRGFETIKAFCAEDLIKERTKKTFERYTNKTVKGVLLYTAQSSLANLITSVGIVGSLWCGMILVSRNVLSIGTLLTYYSLLVYSLGAVERLIGFIPQFLTAGITAERLNDIFDLTPERLIAQKTICANDIRIEDLDFRYGNRERVLHKVALSINAGETIAFVGESGSGKTTLAKLIMGFYPPENGAIFIGGADISTLSQKSVREQISYISQEVFLFADTVRENLLLGEKNITEEEMRYACHLALADHFIEHLPLGYDTKLGENGCELSGGQKQRLAIARALLRKPRILIFDEATSNLDTITENAIKDTISHLDSNITCIIIAHRLSTVKNCDRIYVMEQGQIVETGTHEELLKKGGKYAQMWDRQ